MGDTRGALVFCNPHLTSAANPIRGVGEGIYDWQGCFRHLPFDPRFRRILIGFLETRYESWNLYRHCQLAGAHFALTTRNLNKTVQVRVTELALFGRFTWTGLRVQRRAAEFGFPRRAPNC
jgi:hypothetical protein